MRDKGQVGVCLPGNQMNLKLPCSETTQDIDNLHEAIQAHVVVISTCCRRTHCPTSSWLDQGGVQNCMKVQSKKQQIKKAIYKYWTTVLHSSSSASSTTTPIICQYQYGQWYPVKVN